MSKNNSKPKSKLRDKKEIENLARQEEKVLKQRFGIDVENHPDLEEVARQFEVTRERIREIEKKALQKLGKQGKDDDSDTA